MARCSLVVKSSEKCSYTANFLIFEIVTFSCEDGMEMKANVR